MKILFLNQYEPPDSPPTAKLLGDLAGFLRANGHEVEIISAAKKYGEREHTDRARGASEIRALLRMLWRGLRAPRPDLVVSFSSPPCLVVAAALIARRHRARSIHWALDLYPDLAVALGVLPDGPLARFLRRVVRWSYRQTDRIVTLDDDMRLHLQTHYEVDAAILPPWPPEIPAAAAPSVLGGESWLWLYSGNLGRAHEWKPMLEAQREIERRGLPIRLVIQGGGHAWPEAQRYAKELELKNCFWRDYAGENNLASSLAEAGALVITQKPATRGLLWPSKLALGQLAGKPILWIGLTDGATARILRSAPGNIHGVFPADNAIGIAGWLEKSRKRTLAEPSVAGIDPAAIDRLRCDSLNQWRKWVEAY